MHDLEGNIALESDVMSPKNSSHASLSQQIVDPVAIQGSANQFIHEQLS
jgi:hypothetical protein